MRLEPYRHLSLSPLVVCIRELGFNNDGGIEEAGLDHRPARVRHLSFFWVRSAHLALPGCHLGEHH
jgi:hypothetical protein